MKLQQVQLPRDMSADEGAPHVDKNVWHGVGKQRKLHGKQDPRLHNFISHCATSLGEQIKQQVTEALGQHQIESALDKRFIKYTDAIALSCEKLHRALNGAARIGEIGGNCQAAYPAQEEHIARSEWPQSKQTSLKSALKTSPASSWARSVSLPHESAVEIEDIAQEQHLVRSEWPLTKSASLRSALKSLAIPTPLEQDHAAEVGEIDYVAESINAMKARLHLASKQKRAPSVRDAFSETSSFHLSTVHRVREKQKARYERSATVMRFCWTPRSKALKRFAKGHIFNTWCSAMTVAFAIAVGVDTHFSVRAAVESWQNPNWIADLVFYLSGWFVLEVIFRLAVNGHEYFTESAWCWNVFDMILVGVSIVDHVILSFSGGQSVGVFRVLRIFKVLRALRVVRVLRIFDELRLMVSSILTSIASLMWSLIFLLIITYLASIVFLQGVIQYIGDRNSNDPAVRAQLTQFYGSMPVAIYSLMGCITGGYDWNEPAAPLWSMGIGYGIIFMIFVLISILGVLNVVTGVFVERATRISRIDRDYAISEHLRMLELDVCECMVLFQEIDVEGKGMVETNALMEFLSTGRARGYFSILGIDTAQRKTLARIFDINGDGCITVEEFVGGCIALRGEAKKADIVQLMLEVRQLKEVVRRIDQDVPR